MICRTNRLKTMLAVVFIFLFISSVFVQGFEVRDTSFLKADYDHTSYELDIDYIYNLTERLSNIIFTEYDDGEIAKGRAYGTKGEQKAAEILYENMTKLGLYTTMEQLENTKDYPDLVTELEIIDYHVKIDGEKVASYIAPVWFENEENNNNLNYTYNYTDLKVINPPLVPSRYILKQRLAGEIEPFVIILKDRDFYPHSPFGLLSFWNSFRFHYKVVNSFNRASLSVYSNLWKQYLEHCKGFVLYDFNEDTHNMILLKYFNHLPFIFINGTNGAKILEDIENTRIDFKLQQRLNTSVISYNVIGQLNASNPESETVIISSLYDSWWCQGTADSAIGTAMVLAIAKWFKENNVTPKYNIKFIGFSGEEHGFVAGAKYYENLHKDEKIRYMIDLNQLGFWQDDPKLTLNIISNKIGFLLDIWGIVKESDYANRVNSSQKVRPIFMRNGGPSNTLPFASNRKDCTTVCFLKDSGWKYHHRTGLNHTEGDVLKYFDHEDVQVTGEIVLNVVKYLTVDQLN